MRQVRMVDPAFTTDVSSRSHEHVVCRCYISYWCFVRIFVWDPELHREAVHHVSKGYWESAHEVDEEGRRAIFESFFISGHWISGESEQMNEAYCTHLSVGRWSEYARVLVRDRNRHDWGLDTPVAKVVRALLFSVIRGVYLAQHSPEPVECLLRDSGHLGV